MSDIIIEVETEAVIRRRDGTIKYREWERVRADPDRPGQTITEREIEEYDDST